MNALTMIKRMTVVHKCAACRTILDVDHFEDALCTGCDRALSVAKTETCPTCFKSAVECSCQPRLLSEAGSLCLRRLFFYHPDKSKEPQNRLLFFLKHNRARRAAELLASELWPLVSTELDLLGVDAASGAVLVNLPRRPRSVMLEGLDQSAELCRAISRLYGIPYAPAIKRGLGGKEQKMLNAAERKKNIKSLMRANRAYAESIAGRYVILLDDVVTTGASMAACLPILRKMGSRGVICCCIASDVKKKRNSQNFS